MQFQQLTVTITGDHNQFLFHLKQKQLLFLNILMIFILAGQ